MSKLFHVDIMEINKFQQVISKRERVFDDYNKMINYYNQAKKESGTYINVRFYNAVENPHLANEYDYMINSDPKNGVFIRRSKNESD